MGYSVSRTLFQQTAARNRNLPSKYHLYCTNWLRSQKKNLQECFLRKELWAWEECWEKNRSWSKTMTFSIYSAVYQFHVDHWKCHHSLVFAEWLMFRKVMTTNEIMWNISFHFIRLIWSLAEIRSTTTLTNNDSVKRLLKEIHSRIIMKKLSKMEKR